MGGSRKEIFTAQIFSLKLCLEVSYQMVGREPWKRELIRRLSTIHYSSSCSNIQTRDYLHISAVSAAGILTRIK